MNVAHRRFQLVLIYGIVLLPVVIWQAMQAVQTTANSPLDWAPASFPARVDYDDVARTFGPGDVVVMSWPGCTLDEPRLDRLAEALRRAPAFFADRKWLFHRVVSGREMVQQLTASGVERQVAVQRLRGTMIGPDGAATCVVIGFTKRGLAQRSRLVPLIQKAAEKYCGVPVGEQHLAGPVIDGLSVDLASAATLQKLAAPSSLVIFLVGWWCLRSLRAALVVFGISLYCQAATLALISLCGDTMSALLIVLPPLIQVLALAAGIHLVNYYRATPGDESPADAARRAFRIGWLPCVLSAGTTAIGMASLMVSDLTPIRSFGAYSTAGLLLTTSLVLLFVPTVLAAWRVPAFRNTAISTGPHLSSRSGAGGWSRLLDVIARHHVLVAGFFVVAMIGLGWSMSRLQTSVRIETLFSADSKILADYRWLEEHVAPLVPLEVVVTFDEAGHWTRHQRLEEVRRVENLLRESPEVGGSLSALTFMPELPLRQPRSREEAIALQQAAVQAMLRAEQQWTAMRLLSRTDDQQQWRIRGFVSAVEPIDYGELLAGIRGRLQSGMTAPHMAVHATGIMPLVHEIQRQLMTDLRSSFLLAFLIITIVMTVMQGGVEAGLVAMLPNIFPTLLIFGLLGWWRVPVDIGSVMTASIALGVAVDDTFHFLTHFQRSLSEGLGRRAAVLSAYQNCGRAMLQSSIICGAGMLVFALSDFVPTARFAWMMVALFTAAIVGDLIFLPALLVGPLGKLWEASSSSAFSPAADPSRQPASADHLDTAPIQRQPAAARITPRRTSETSS